MAIVNIEKLFGDILGKNFHFRGKNIMREEFNYAYNKAEATPVLDIKKWLTDSRELKGAYRSGRIKRKGSIELAPLEYFFEVTDAKIVRL